MRTIDLLLADIVMPQMSGPELAEKFSSQRPGVPILFMSGHTDHRALVDGVPPGYLQKPFTAAALLARLQTLLEPPASKTGPENGK